MASLVNLNGMMTVIFRRIKLFLKELTFPSNLALYSQVVNLKSSNPQLKVMLAVGGKYNSKSDLFL